MTATDVTMLLSEMKNEPLAVSGSVARGKGEKILNQAPVNGRVNVIAVIMGLQMKTSS